MSYPSYLELFESGELQRRAEEAFARLSSCDICPRKCKVNRLKDEKGFCKTGLKARVCSYMPHHGEEPAISGSRGSGTVFFSYCNLGCVYCQNYEFSQLGEGKEVEPQELASFMLELERMGCHNINFVSPTHVMPQILKALVIAIEKGFKLPLVYNTGGYELAEVITLLDGSIDIYLPDMRYNEASYSEKYSAALDYPRFNRDAVREMHRQVGVADLDDEGVILKGLIIRHLVLPENISGTNGIMKFISQELDKNTYVGLMSQYRPYYKAFMNPPISRRITSEEYEAAKAAMRTYGLHNGWIQESYGLERFAGVHIKPNIAKTDGSS